MRLTPIRMTTIVVALALAGLAAPGNLVASDPGGTDAHLTEATTTGGVAEIPHTTEIPTAGGGRMIVVPAESQHVIHATVDPDDPKPVVGCD